MIPLSSSTKKKIIAWVMAIFFTASSFFVFNTVRAIPVEQVVDVPSALKYVLDKTGSIFFQNIGRKVINDFAYDAATYLGAGGKGQKALFIKEKWGDHWQNIADKALGDFVESFAKSVVSDIAANNKEKGFDKTQCANAYNACLNSASAAAETANGTSDTTIYEKAAAACEVQQQKCVDSNTTESAKKAKCDEDVAICKNNCNAADPSFVGPQNDPVKCENDCETVYNFCWSKVATDRTAPMLNTNKSPLANIDICNPRLDVAIRINFGLTIDYQQKKNIPYSANCSFSEMVGNWKTEADRQKAIYTDKDYLNKLTRSFRPGANDLSVAFEVNTSIGDYKSGQVTIAKDETVGGGGWLDVRNFAGDLLGTPNEAKSRKDLTDEKLWENLGKVTGDILVDAANIFINQLMITGWQTLTSSLVDDTKSSSPTSYWSTAATGRKSIENKISQIKEPVYAGGQKLNILADLASCQTPENPGPAECVIDTNFSNAITNKMTVAQALDSGSLQNNWPFGFDMNGQEKLQYNQGYPYRSMIILRKYRILPVGWELAAQKIEQMYANKNNSLTKKSGKNQLQEDIDVTTGTLKEGTSLLDVVSCFDATVEGDIVTQGPDKYNSYAAAWCIGLVDPNWVLKLPDYFCGRLGYGPQLVQDYSIQNSGQKSCGVMDPLTGIIGRVEVDGAFKNCSVDNDCCTRQENVNNGNSLRGQKPTAPCSASCLYQETKLTFARSEKYCADDQSCIKEDKDGKCLAYGYCTRERRQWVFDQKGQDQVCEPYYNTCKSYKLGSTNVSYLENTLDFNSCNADNSGCRAYSIQGAYNVLTSSMAWNNNEQIYFNGRVKPCNQNQEGCRQLLRTQVDSGVNLIADGDFEANDSKRWEKSNVRFGSLYNGAVLGTNMDKTFVAGGEGSMLVDSSNSEGLYYGPRDKNLLPRGFEFEIDQAYTLSADIYVQSGSVEIGVGNENLNNYKTVEATATGWNNYALTVDNDFTLQADSIRIRGNGVSIFYLDNVKFELGGSTGFSTYGSASQVYQKLLPDYLTKQCYVNPPADYSLKSDAPAVCSTFVRRCNKDEVGCNLFVDNITKDQTAAKVKPKDYCPGECLGYDKFIQQTNVFNSARLEHFIPRTAKTCDVKMEGCSKFVNLDKIAEGGEENEYFLDFRRCTKPGNTCDDYITWEGSDVSGYQITSFKLEKNTDTPQNQPRTVVDSNPLDEHDSNANGDDLCSETIFKLPADHPLANSDCRQFFGKDGSISYHLYSKTVICVDDCFYYRQVDLNIDPLITNPIMCEGTGGVTNRKWLTDTDQCAVCLNDGVWDNNHNSCVFRAWPNESVTCNEANVGCSKYIGDTGHNVKMIINDVFESNSPANWYAGGADQSITAQVTSDALSVGGHSIQPPDGGTLSKKLNAGIRPGKKYILTFMARRRDQVAQIDSISMVYNFASNGSMLEFTKGGQGLVLTNKWQSYKFSIDNISGNGTLASIDFKGIIKPDQIRLDNIKLIEVEDVYYLIKNSWTTPASCDQDHRGRPFPYYMSGCREYTDMNKATHNLRSFDQLCQDSAAGCELMIDTFNSSAYGASAVNNINTPADEMAYVVYDQKKSCDTGSKGCQYFGKANRIGSYSSVYLLNNPDSYNEILCQKNALFCETWVDQTGSNVYFKDPGEKVCEYLTPENGTEGWYTKQQQFCFSTTACELPPANGDLSQYKDTCQVSGMSCVADESGQGYCQSGMCKGQSDCKQDSVCRNNAVVPCPTSYHKTIGLGVADDKLQPIGMADPMSFGTGNAGLCQSAQAGCTEYIDPESVFNYDLWQGADPVSANSLDYEVTIKPDTLYILKSGSATGTTAKIDCPNYSVYELSHYTNEVSPISGQTFLSVSPENVNGKMTAFSREFYIHSPSDTISTDEVTCKLTSGLADNVGVLREAAVAYRLKASLTKETPTTVNFNEGKILFNERSQNGASKKPLTYSTVMTPVNSAPLSVNSNQASGGNGTLTPALFNNANTLLKVDPDRVCDQWLSCKTYIINPLKADDRICVERALCDRLNKANECSHFVGFQPTANNGMPANQNYGDTNSSLTTSQLSNLSGYSVVGFSGSNKNDDYYHLAGMVEVGGPKVKLDGNGSFEGKSTTGFKNADNNTDVIVINDPKAIEKELGLEAYRYVPDGQAVGKMSGNAYTYVNNPGTGDMIVSVKVFIRTGSKASLRIGSNDDTTCPLDTPACSTNGDFDAKAGPTALIAQVTANSQWVTLIGKFSLSGSYGDKDIKLWLVSNGITYFDNLRIEPALTYRDDATGKPDYMQGACRLFPERDSTACDYFDGSGLRRKGWSGYCLQYDPRDSTQCILWYPLDRIAGDEFEEGASLSIDKDLYYCVYAEDQCNKVVPEFACKTFVKVNKDSYWHDRIAEGSAFNLAPGIFNDNNKLSVDFGIDNPPVKPGGVIDKSLALGIGWNQGSGFYGAYSSRDSITTVTSSITIGPDTLNGIKRLMPIVPFSGVSQAGQNDPYSRTDKFMCKGTITDKGDDAPISLASALAENNGSTFRPVPGDKKYDTCTVAMVAQLRDNDLKNDKLQFDKYCSNEYFVMSDRLKPSWPCKNASHDDYSCFDYSYRLCSNNKGDPVRCMVTPNASISCNPRACQGNDFCNTPILDTPFLASQAVTSKTMPNSTTSTPGVWYLGCSDWRENSKDTLCLFDCYNHTQDYSIGKTTDNAYWGIQRLFTQVDGFYKWDGSSYAKSGFGQLLQRMPHCQNNVRPAFDNNNKVQDYCYVKPVVGDITVSTHKIRKQGYVTLSFTSNVDSEQLPLKRVEIDMGIKPDGTRLVKIFNLNIFDRKDKDNPHKFLLTYDINDIKHPVGDPEVHVQPCVTIYDNWSSTQTVLYDTGGKEMSSFTGDRSKDCLQDEIIITNK